MREQLEEVRRLVAGPPALHRYTSLMPEALVDAAARVCDEYDGDAGRIWADEPTAAELDARFRRFKRVGPKKAAMAVELLMTHFGVDVRCRRAPTLPTTCTCDGSSFVPDW